MNFWKVSGRRRFLEKVYDERIRILFMTYKLPRTAVLDVMEY